MSTVHSADGTPIAFDARGEGQPLILVGGATSHRAVNQLDAEVGKLLRDQFRVYAYDRRGRGESGDTAPYAVQREIEDLAALIEDAGAPALVCGFSSGAVLSLDAAAAGLPTYCPPRRSSRSTASSTACPPRCWLRPCASSPPTTPRARPAGSHVDAPRVRSFGVSAAGARAAGSAACTSSPPATRASASPPATRNQPRARPRNRRDATTTRL